MPFARPIFNWAHRSLRRNHVIIYVALTSLLASLFTFTGTSIATPAHAVSAQAHSLAALPLSFEPNVGQAGPGVQYLSHGRAGAILFSPGDITFALPGSNPRSTGRDHAQVPTSPPTVAHLRFLSTSSASAISAENILPGRTNYLQGRDPSQWHTHTPTYAGITYRTLYPGIDLAYSGAGGNLKGTYTVAPGADPTLIRWRYDSAQSVQVDSVGNLLVTYSTAAGGPALLLTEQAPVAWQDATGQRTPVQAHYLVDSGGNVTFSLGSYDHSLPLVVDPTLVFSTFLGGIGEESGYGIAVDPTGNIYLAGYTSSSHTYPPMNPYQEAGLGYWDAVITKFSPDGQTMLFSSFFAGTDWDVATGIVTDAAGNVYICGETTSTDFPLRNPFQATYGGGPYDAFLSEFSSTGDLIFSTYLGGSGLDRAQGMAIDKSGKVTVTGYTDSKNFPLEKALRATYGGGFDDAFVTRLDPATSKLVYSTYLGGRGTDYGWSVASDGDGNALVTGYTGSADFPIQNAFQTHYNGGPNDVFVSKLSADGSSLLYSTYLGGGSEEQGEGIAVDGSGNAYVTGFTSSSNFPTSNPFQPQKKGSGTSAFVTKLNPSGSGLIYSTYLGGSTSSTPGIGDQGLAIAVNAEGSAYVVGSTGAVDFPLMKALQPDLGGKTDAFVTKLNPSGSGLDFSTFLGGVGEDYPFALALDGKDNLYITGSTHSSNFPVAKPYQMDMFGSGDLFLSEISDMPDTVVTPQVARKPQAAPTYIYIVDDDGNPAPDPLPIIGAPAWASTPWAAPTVIPDNDEDATPPNVQSGKDTGTETPSSEPGITSSVSPGPSAFPTFAGTDTQDGGGQNPALAWVVVFLAALVSGSAVFFLVRRSATAPPAQRPSPKREE